MNRLSVARRVIANRNNKDNIVRIEGDRADELIRKIPMVSKFISDNKDNFLKYKNLFLKGGCARAALMESIGKANTGIRDIDAIIFGSNNVELTGVADFETEHGSIEHYMRSRDVTVNQALIRPGLFITTRRAIADAVKGRLSISENEVYSHYYEYYDSFSEEHVSEYQGKRIGPRVAMRAILFAIKNNMDIRENPLLEDALRNAGTFNFTIHLLKAIESGIAREFLSVMHYFTNNESYDKTPGVLISECLNNLYGFDLQGRGKQIVSEINKSNKNGDVVEDIFDLLKKYPELEKEYSKIEIEEDPELNRLVHEWDR